MRVKWLEYDGPAWDKKIRYTLDININAADFMGRAGMAWLLMIANPNLSISELLVVLAANDCKRTRGWISRRRWMFFDPRPAGGAGNADGKNERAFRIMGQYPNVSARELARILRKKGIKRGKDWVIKHRTVQVIESTST